VRFTCCFRYEPEAPGFLVYIPGKAALAERIEFKFLEHTMRIPTEIRLDEV
jgi:hypothetical protein